MLSHSINNLLFLLFAVSALVSLDGCYEPESGCLDLFASNYEVASDNGCDNCCTYPSFRVEMKHIWKDTTFSFGDTLTNEIGSSFVLLDQKFYLSNWSYNLSDGTTFESRDSINLLLADNEIFINKDIVLVRQNQSAVTNHTYRQEGRLISVNFTLGISDLLNDITSAAADEYSPLSFDNDLYVNNAYQSQWLQLGIGSDYSDTINLYFEEDISFNLLTDTMFQKGQNVGIPMTLIYDSLFAKIDFEMSSDTEIKEQIQMNKTNWIK